MADKEKRIQKLLSKTKLKVKVKKVGTLEEASSVIVEDLHTMCNNVFYDKKGYQDALLKGETFPEDRVHFMVSSNPRNSHLVVRGVINKARGLANLKE